MKNLKRIAAIFASSTALLGGCDLLTETDRYSFECMSVAKMEYNVGTFRAPRGYAVSMVDGLTSMQIVAVSGSDRKVEQSPIPNGSDCSISRLVRR